MGKKAVVSKRARGFPLNGNFGVSAIKKFFIPAFSVFVFLSGLVPATPVRAQGLSNVSYPIAELGNCGSRAECKIFCDEVANYVACSQWAAKNGLFPKDEVAAVEKEVEQVKKFESGEISEGPGGCKNPAECDAYCQLPEHGEECFKFGLEHKLISPEEAKQIQKQVEESKGPGGCKTNEDCEEFCSRPENFELCASFAVKEGSLTQDEAREALEIMRREKEMREARPQEFRPEPKKPKIDKEKAEKILKKQSGPGGCKTLEECRQYCEDLSHAKECLGFVEKNNLVSDKELKTMKDIMESGGPGGCRGPKECDEYCSLSEHQKECLEFAKEHNLVSPEEAKTMEKMAGGGPGGCRNQQECDKYCKKPEHMEECLMFSVKQGMMTEEDAQKMIEIMKKQEERGLKLKGVAPTEEMSPYKGMPHMFEKGMPKENEWHGRGDEEQSRMAPEEFIVPQSSTMPQGHPMMPETAPQYQGMTGPGGCKSKAECDAYCSKPEHMKACSEFSGGAGEMLPGQQEGEPMSPQDSGYMPVQPQMPSEYEMDSGGGATPEAPSSSLEVSFWSLLKQIRNFFAFAGAGFFIRF